MADHDELLGAPALCREHLSALFADLRATAPRVRPIGPAEHAERRRRAAVAIAAAGHDALLVEGGALLAWLSGIELSRSERLFGFVLAADGAGFWIAPAFEEERARGLARATGGDVATWREDEYAWRPLAAALAERRLERLVVEPSARAFVLAALQAELGPDRVACGGAAAHLRAQKDEHEIELLTAADGATRRALARVAELLRPGWTERDVHALCLAAQEAQGLRNVWALALFGPSSALPHGASGDRALRAGDVVLVDTGGALAGYQSDHTRTWTFDAAPDAEFERAWNAVRDAQRRAREALRPGAETGAADRAARASLDAAGYGPGDRLFTHRLGHGIGLEGHEPPYLDGASTVRVEPGMTFTDEPGVYLPGQFGLRLEDVVVVGTDESRALGPWATSPRGPS